MRVPFKYILNTMRKLIFTLLFIPFLAGGQTPEPLVDLSKYHDNDRLWEMTDLNFSSITDGSYTISVIKADSISVGAVYYSDTYWDDLRVPMTNTKLNPSKSEPALEEIVTGVLAYAFESDADSSERLNFIAQIPHNRKLGTDIECHLHWSPSTTNTGDCYWRFSYTVISIDGTFGAITNLRVADAGDGTALKHQFVSFGDIDGTDLGMSSVLIGNITRLGEAVADDFTGVAYGLEFDIHYQIDSPGSGQELVK